jgi:hypothetical protein
MPRKRETELAKETLFELLTKIEKVIAELDKPIGTPEKWSRIKRMIREACRRYTSNLLRLIKLLDETGLWIFPEYKDSLRAEFYNASNLEVYRVMGAGLQELPPEERPLTTMKYPIPLIPRREEKPR